MIKNRRIVSLLAPLLLFSLFLGCFLPFKGFREKPQIKEQPKTPPKRAPGTPEAEEQEKRVKHKKSGGVYHTVERGQTIYRIAKAYDVPQEDIIEANGIQDVTKVRVGQVLFIPGGRKTKKTEIVLGEMPSNPPSRPEPPNNGNPTPPANPPTHEPPPSSTEELSCPRNAVPLIWPITGNLTSNFGIRNGRQHDGIDIQTAIGTDIVAAADGTVIFADRLGGYGLMVILKHEGELKTIYAHNRKNLVRKGDVVKQGDKIAELGNSGNATGPHLHFEVRCGQDAVDPILYLPGR